MSTHMNIDNLKDINMPNESALGKSSMVTYSKVLCCVCGVTMDATQSGMCETCFKNNIDISEGITKQGLIHYCRQCDRYLKTGWIRCSLESSDMMTLCLGKVKGLNKSVKILDSSFVWTEPHSKRIKVKLSIQKEVLNGVVVQKTFIVEFVVEWIQCDDCKKTFTPHIWNAACQIRQKVNHKRTFLLMEQLIMKHQMHSKAVNIKEMPEGIDFYFQNKSQANSLSDFITHYFPAKIRHSKKLISHDQHSNIYNYKYSFLLEIAPVCKDDLIVLDKATCKELGGINPVLLCTKISSRIHLIDVMTLTPIDFDENTYWRYNFRSYIDRDCLQEFLIINVEEEIDYKNFSKVNSSSTMNSNRKDNHNTSLNSKYSIHADRRDFKIVVVQCIHNNQSKDGNMNLITVRSHLGEKMRPGDVYCGFDLTSLNASCEIDSILEKNGNYPDVVLVRKKYIRKNNKRIWKLKHLDKEDVDMTESKKKLENDERNYEKFLDDIEEDKDIRKQVNLYKDDDAIKELEERFKNMHVDDKNDSDIDIKVEELLDSLTLNDKNEEEKKDTEFIVPKDLDPNKKKIKIDKNIKKKVQDSTLQMNDDKKQLGKRDRQGDNLNESRD